MRRAIWMALALVGTVPPVALAQQNAGTQPPAAQPPAASPSGAASLQEGQDTAGMGGPGAPGQQSAGSVGTATGAPTGGAGMQGPGVATGLNSVQQEQGASGTGGAGPTYRGTTPEMPSASPPLEAGPGRGAGTAGAAGTSGVRGTGAGEGPSPAAMQRELANLRERVARLEGELEALRGTGGSGTGGSGAAGTSGSANVQTRGSVAVATAVFDGRVVSVTPREIAIEDTSDGSLYRLAVDDRTKAFVAPRLNRIPVEQLPEGTPVRASFEYISGGVERALNIVAQPQPPPRPRQGTPPEPAAAGANAPGAAGPAATVNLSRPR
ncbi:hypothetical protein [Vitiosangium sp. GDMCC 1.1324]|uniref:hypothetical protein n=1 Tax=Vitiosangium sp. (strain GDMCC 1.1324) TaxID=2138576 RepID=UPI000D3967E4|nr:hypothetical protein [Vitiosangium sp. GDMCC 1.1324]PTL76779.1 hypothetical protein DAT35_48515 [Vitiosangium sp. GDMCC 1.1324]